jgi:hypothetical protein
MTQCHIARRDPRRHLSFCIQRGLRPRQPALTGNGGTTMWPRRPKGSPDQAVVKSRGKFALIFGAESEMPDPPPPDRRRSRSPAMRQRWLTMFEIDLDIGAFSPCPLHTTGQIQMNFFDWGAARKAFIALIADKKSVREIAEKLGTTSGSVAGHLHRNPDLKAPKPTDLAEVKSVPGERRISLLKIAYRGSAAGRSQTIPHIRRMGFCIAGPRAEMASTAWRIESLPIRSREPGW